MGHESEHVFVYIYIYIYIHIFTIYVWILPVWHLVVSPSLALLMIFALVSQS
jgi:hypothetical protein